MMRRLLIYMVFPLAAIAIAVLGSGCYYDVEEEIYPMMDCDTSAVSYTGDILPILQANCYECHGNGHMEGGVSLDPHANLKLWADAGRVVGAIRHKAGFSPMPKDRPMLSNCEILLIETWVNNGSPDN